ncbi:MAG: NAD(+) synthase [Deltaproteobacteria bacterium]|nr:NAD(+) synthase [Deltaproteobacteria bacterium]
MAFTRDSVKLGDRAGAEVERICAWMRETALGQLKRRGVVLGLSGGIDSSVVAALAVKAFGADKVLGLFMNEGESADDTVRLARLIADHLGIATVNEDISPMLVAAGCYQRRDDAIRTVIPRYAADWKCKIVLPSVLDSDRYRIYSVVVRSPDGETITARLPPAAYLQVVAATNFKQRVRKMLEYFHADRLVYAVAGTPNLLEYDQGFFVKNGDGSADLKPIAHLYKTQVYELAAALGVPDEIRQRPPTTDTYSLPQSQEEFYFSLPYDAMDACLYARDHAVPLDEVAAALGLTAAQVERVFRDIDGKRAGARYLHAGPQTMTPG